MSWNIWDAIIIAVVLLQCGAIGVLGFVLIKLYQGPIVRYIQIGMRLAKTGTHIGVSGLSTFGRSWMKGEKLVRETKGIAKGVQYGTRTDFGDEISYRSLLTGWASLQSGLGSVIVVLGFLKGLGKKKDAPPPGPTSKPTRPARPPRRSLPDRMGLVPPIAKPLGRVVNFGRIAWEVRNELKRRGISPF